jgi:hypothetical protein
MDQPSTPPLSPAAPPVQPPAQSEKKSSPFPLFIVLLLGLLIGGLITYFLLPAKMNRLDSLPKVNVQNNRISLPTNAIQIQKCADYKGTLFVEPENIPVGPVYMVKNGEVIGIEYMLSKEEFLNGKSYKFLKGLGLKVDHVNIGLLSKGHEGYTAPHYHVDIYTVPQDFEQQILCGTPTAVPVPEVSTTPAVQPSPEADTASPAASPSVSIENR